MYIPSFVVIFSFCNGKTMENGRNKKGKKNDATTLLQRSNHDFS